MREIYELDTVPYDEGDCASVSDTDYMFWAKIECSAYIDQIRRTIGNEPDGSSLYCKWCRHDFGTYAQVGYKFFYGREEHRDYMRALDVGIGDGKWDDVALNELQNAGYFSWLQKMKKERYKIVV